MSASASGQLGNRQMSPIEFTVELAPWSLAPWLSQVFTGLYDLQDAGVIVVRLVDNLGGSTWLDRFTVPMRVTECRTGKTVVVAIDLNDTSKFSIKSGLETVDVVFKRSYKQQLLKSHSADFAERTLPYGFNYNCYSRSVPTAQLSAYHYGLRLKTLGKSGRTTRAAWRTHHLRFLLSGIPNNISIFEDSFRWQPDAPSQPRVFFVTRLHASQQDGKEIEYLSRQRVELVRTLKSELGSRFVGGIVKDKLSRRRCPKELLFDKVSRRTFVRMLRGSDILISTLGIGKSTPWKFAEGMAASRCILSEPLFFDVPDTFQIGTHYHEYRSVEDCVEKSYSLLENPDCIRATKYAVWKFYERYGRASALMEGLLRRAVEFGVSSTYSARSQPVA
jgi:hypothetical protein